jgi:hypothetical protein
VNWSDWLALWRDLLVDWDGVGSMRFSLFRGAVLCAVVLGLVMAGGRGVSAQATGSLTVHARYCDPGVVPDNPFAECHDNLLTGFAVDFDGVPGAATTGDDGNATFTGLDPDQHVLFVHMPLKATSPVIFCSVEGGDGSELTLTSGDTDAGVSVPVEAGQNVICDWYWLISDQPSAGSPVLTVHAMTCPGSDVPADFWAACSPNPAGDVEFFSGPTSLGTTDSNGMLIYNLGASGSVDLNGGVPGEFARDFIFCSDDADKSTVVDLIEVAAGTSASVAVGPGGVTCDWFIVPENLSGQTPTPAPTGTAVVTQLPNTGAGNAAGGSGSRWLMALFGVIALGALSVLLKKSQAPSK